MTAKNRENSRELFVYDNFAEELCLFPTTDRPTMAAVVDTLTEKLQKAWAASQGPLKNAIHWGFIPAVIVAGMTLTEPKPTVGQLLGF